MTNVDHIIEWVCLASIAALALVVSEPAYALLR
jgi:hypothetical protein